MTSLIFELGLNARRGSSKGFGGRTRNGFCEEVRERLTPNLAIEDHGVFGRRDGEKTMVTANEVRSQRTTLVFDRPSCTKIARASKSNVRES